MWINLSELERINMPLSTFHYIRIDILDCCSLFDFYVFLTRMLVNCILVMDIFIDFPFIIASSLCQTYNYNNTTGVKTPRRRGIDSMRSSNDKDEDLLFIRSQLSFEKYVLIHNVCLLDTRYCLPYS